ncbi:endonuclease [Haematobacter massiliensis]|uniref:HNH endonuclease n=1 Tax=Haematobacter massiliensis TaxID=195105 RepID=UPI000B4A504A|nr:HNH endonuclease signature motif containing protein [Haematobacter massiliensis]OWJ72518.1 endonuclease [Haematobacter massiliensis]
MAVTRKEFTRHSRPVLKSARWQVLRWIILERDGWQCVCCGARRRLEVDHIKPVRNAPELAFDPANLQALCPSCHTRKTRLECGHKETSPERRAWMKAVKDLAAQPSSNGETHA